MTRFRTASRGDDHLSNYWNALVRNAPADELARLANFVEPADIAAIEEAHAAHERYEPDPLFARRLEQVLIDATMSSMGDTAQPTPHPRVTPPSWNGSVDQPPVSHRRSTAPRPRAGWSSIPAMHIALAFLLVLASIGGTWWVASLQDDPQPLIAPSGLQGPEDTTGVADYSDHPLVGAWNAPVGMPESHGLPCWCIATFTADGIAMAIDPRPDWRASNMASETVALGIWQPTGERTAVSIVRFPANDGGYIERTFSLEVSEDGQTMTSAGTQRAIDPDGFFATLPNVPTIDMVRITMPDAEQVATPTE